MSNILTKEHPWGKLPLYLAAVAFIGLVCPQILGMVGYFLLFIVLFYPIGKVTGIIK